MVIHGHADPYIEKEWAGRTERRRIQEQKLRRTKRQCIILVVVTVVLAFLAVFRMIAEKRQQETDAWSRIYTDGAEGGAKGYTGADGETASAQDLLVLVNKDHRIPADYQLELQWLQNRSCAVSATMYPALRDMLTDGSEEGLSFVVASGYRSGEYQQQLLDEDIAASMAAGLTYEQAYDLETRETMPPGYSEHETGLAVDVVSLDYQILDEMQELTPENVWLRENCSRYGFILRYPVGSEEITGIDYEPWHFRYVGKEAAQEIMSRGITLEEYLGVN